MENYKITVAVKPTDKYEKARQALLEAKTAMSELSQQQQEQLVKELVGTDALTSAYAMLKKLFG